MIPFWLQEPPAANGASQRVWACPGPPGRSRSRRWSFSSPMNPIDLPSGDQKGEPVARNDPSAPKSGTTSVESSDRSQIWYFCFQVVTKMIRFPSGETAGVDVDPKGAPSGG